jgi:hypothetical protein
MSDWVFADQIKFDEQSMMVDIPGGNLALPFDKEFAECRRTALRHAAEFALPVALLIKNKTVTDFDFPFHGGVVGLSQGENTLRFGLRGSARAFEIQAGHPDFTRVLKAIKAGENLYVIADPESCARPLRCEPTMHSCQCRGTGSHSSDGISYVHDIVCERASALFTALQAVSLIKPGPFTDPIRIPFLFPDDGCEERAHKSFQLLTTSGLALEAELFKVRIEVENGRHVKTCNSPVGCVNWGFHVSLCVRVGGESLVLDPALFAHPVPVADWKERINGGDSRTSETFLPAWTFRHAGGDSWTRDDGFENTNGRLVFIRHMFERRVCKNGWPPYG